ncbi:hypothetical protein KDJ56_12390 [Brevibacillus composti]|uniref:Uncharacterized protein n=1 Tax=Brevibacillus composti TaxID=2796470 RepID=A0A7T5JLY3_9BACL|nr:hypothetical protein [Brevibacillus composti]QQE72763.1 hypothetical protein JD108_12445 [Brevibacillus composti]QUO39841.1 hypothetical protein KDJ56_12390 [Brevibacillus composti]
MPRRLFLAIAVSAFLAAMLSFVPTLSIKQADVPAFQASRPVELSEQNVVDLFTFLSTHYKIKRVKWENPSVFVDLAVSPGDAIEPGKVYRDFYSLTHDVFRLTGNVEHLFFRLLERKETDKSTKLLIAIEANRPDRAAYDLSPDKIEDVEAHVRSRFAVRIDPYFYDRVSP